MSRAAYGVLLLVLVGALALRASPRDAPAENPARPKDAAEGRALQQLRAMTAQRGFANVSETDGRLIRLLTEAIGAKQVVEVGTSNGYSAIWFALALRMTGGRLWTHEIDPQRVALARANLEKAGLGEYVTVIPGDAHETVLQHQGPIDVVFLDADKSGYLDYLQKLLPRVRSGGLVIAHNMRYPTPQPEYLEAVTRDPRLETSFLLMEGAGLGVTLKKR